MLALLLMLSSAASDDVARFTLSPARPRPGCISAACTRTAREQSYRVPAERDPLAKTSKERAFAADGTKCSVVGDKRCPVRGRKIFSTDFSE
jgi:hypothetical protein